MTTKKRSITDFFVASKSRKLEVEVEEKEKEKEEVKKLPSDEDTTTCSSNSEKSADQVSTTTKTNNDVKTTAFNDFDKDQWLDSLTEEQKDLLQLEISTMDISWLSILYKELTKNYFLDLKRFLKIQYESGQTIFPPQEDIYSWTRLTPVSKVKVVILGQDPYHNFNQAHGLAFSVKDESIKIPPSLKNIYKCLKKEYPDSFEIPKSANLTKWAENEGILLLNTCLTVKAHNANSHSKRGWETFTTAAIRNLINFTNNEQKRGLVLLGWGMPAQKTILNVGKIDWDLNLFLKSVHPSPLSASRGFFDCGHFTSTNSWLESRYGEDAVIDWNL